MIYIPPPLPPDPPSDQGRNKKSATRRTLHRRHNSIGTRSRMWRIGNPFETTQGVSTLKIVLLYSVLGMILNWVLPIVILQFKPEMLKEDANYFGTVAAIVITIVLLMFSLFKQLIFRSRSRSEDRKRQGINIDIYGSEHSEREGK